MRTLISLVVAFVVVSILTDGGASTQRSVTGTVTGFEAAEWLLIDSMEFPIDLRATTTYEDRERDSLSDRAAIKPGVRVTVWYRSMWERRPVADKVRLLTDAATP